MASSTSFRIIMAWVLLQIIVSPILQWALLYHIVLGHVKESMWFAFIVCNTGSFEFPHLLKYRDLKEDFGLVWRSELCESTQNWQSEDLHSLNSQMRSGRSEYYWPLESNCFISFCAMLHFLRYALLDRSRVAVELCWPFCILADTYYCKTFESHFKVWNTIKHKLLKLVS